METKIYFAPTIPDEAWGWRNDRRIWKWCRQYTGITERAQQSWVESLESDSTVKMFGVYYDDENGEPVPVGVCGFTSIDKHNQTAEFSCYIGPEYQRRGFARQTLLNLFGHGFQNMNFNRIWGEVFDGNPAMALFESLGMEKEGVLRETYFRGGKFINSTIVSLLRKDCEWIR